MARNILILSLLYAHCSASPTPKPTTSETTAKCYAECKKTLEHIGASTTSLTLQNIQDSLDYFLECNRACTSEPGLSLSELMTIQSRGSKSAEDVKLSARGSADKERYIPSLIKMCQATGLRECLRPLAPSIKENVKRDLAERAASDESSATGVSSPMEADSERCTTTGRASQATLDVKNKKFRFRGGGGGKGGGGKGGGGGGKHNGATNVGEGWALRIGVIVCLVGWVGFVGLL